MSENKTRYDWLGPIRMLIIGFIAFGYASTMPRGPQEAEYLRMFGYDPSWYGISVIFMITGWLSLRSLQRHGSPLKFLTSRLGRNMPILVIFAAIVPLVLFPVFGVAAEPGTSRLSQHLSYFVRVVSCVEPSRLTPGLLDNALYMCVIQGGLWTFRWGMVAFVATAILWALGGLKDRRLLFGLTALTLAAYVPLVMYGTKAATPLIEFAVPGLRLGFTYLVGMCAYAYREKLRKTLLVPVALLGATLVQYFLLPWTPLIEVGAGLALGYLAFLGITSKRTAPGWVKKLPDLSLGIYVINWPMAQIILLMMPSLSPLGLFAVSFPLTVALSLTIWGVLNRTANAKMERMSGLNAT